MNIISKESYVGWEYTHQVIDQTHITGQRFEILFHSETLIDNFVCVSQGWLTEDQSIILLDDELDEFYAPSEDQ